MTGLSGEVGSTYEVTRRPPVLARCAATAWVRTRARVRVRVRVGVGVGVRVGVGVGVGVWARVRG